jgi:hypothetical protein
MDEGFQAVHQRVAAGQQATENLCRFLRARISAEEAFSQSLRQLTEDANNNAARFEHGSLKNALEEFQGTIASRPKPLQIFCENVYGEVYQPLVSMREIHKEKQLQMLAEGDKICEEVRAADSSFRNSNRKYMKLFQEVCSAVVGSLDQGSLQELGNCFCRMRIGLLILPFAVFLGILASHRFFNVSQIGCSPCSV